jgi:hypothetical protein
MAYDEIFQALAVERYLLFSKPHLDLSFDNVIRWKLLTSDTFLVHQHRKVQSGQVRAVWWVENMPGAQ